MKACIKEQSLYEAVLNASKEYSSATAVSFFNKKISYAQIIYKINQFAQGLKDLGLHEGDVVTTVLPNIPEAVYLFYASNQLGLIINPLHPILPLHEIERTTKITKSKVLFCLNKRYLEISSKISNVFAINPMHERSSSTRLFAHVKHVKCIDEFYKKMPYTEYIRTIYEDAVYLNSGGTTGTPKIVRISSFAFNASAANYEWIVGEQERTKIGILAVLPMFHGFGLTVGIHYALANGSKSVLLPRFNRKLTVKFVKNDIANILIGIPLFYKKLLKQKGFKGKKLQNLKFAFVGGDFVPHKLQTAFNSRMEEAGSKCRLRAGYGLTETLSIFSVNNYQYLNSETVGLPFPNMECLVVDENMKPLPNGESGELLVRGEITMNGYLEHDDEYVEVNSKSYIRTGDIVLVNNDGALVYKQRAKRIIKVSGVPVFPSEVEDQVISLPFVYDAAIIGIEDEHHDHMLKLFVVLQRNNKLPIEDVENQIKNHLLSTIGVYALPKEIVYIRKIPKTLVGKIDVKLLSNQED